MDEVDASPGVTPKRKKSDSILRRYPIVPNSIATAENSETLEQHCNAIATELRKAKPRDTVLLPLLRLTYDQRRMFILDGLRKF